MATKPETKYTKYNKKRNRKEYDQERRQKQKEEKDLQKYRELNKELIKTKENTWFDENRNPYLERLEMNGPSEEYEKEKQKRFFLRYDMDHLWEREKGDTKKYNRNKQMAYNNVCREKDLFNRIQYYRIFRREFKRRMNGESPDETNQHMNNCYIPSELNSESSDYRPELLHLLEEGENSDPKMKVLIPPEWAQKLIDEDSSDSYDSDFDGT